MTNPIRYGNKFFRGHPTGSKSFTQSETWVVPTGVRYINAALVGAGGNGGSGYNTEYNDRRQAGSGGGGGGGFILRQNSIRVHRGDIVSVVVGSGATTLTVNGMTYTANRGNNGGGGWWNNGNHAGGGGSGESGGGGGNTTSSGSSPQYVGRRNGGSNGANGTSGCAAPEGMFPPFNNGGAGTGNNCYINGVLFSSGGRGGAVRASNPCNEYPYSGGANTGNGGDAGNGGYSENYWWGASGGTGFALVTW